MSEEMVEYGSFQRRGPEKTLHVPSPYNARISLAPELPKAWFFRFSFSSVSYLIHGLP